MFFCTYIYDNEDVRDFMRFLLSKKREADGHSRRHYPPMAENALFWMLLVLVSIGCTTSLYERALQREDISGVSSESVFRTVKAAGRNYQVKGRNLPIYCVETDRPQVALTFDAAWGNEDTRRLSEILAAHEVKVTFFMTGGWVEKYPEDVKHMADLGHELGNHSESHKNMSQLSKAEIGAELQKVHDKVKALTGKEMTLFRAPYGDYDNKVIEIADTMGYYPIQWDVDSLDWKDYGADSIVDQVLNHPHLGNGSIILMHNGARYTSSALEAVITGLQQKGYEIVPVSELIWKENFRLDQEGRQISSVEPPLSP